MSYRVHVTVINSLGEFKGYVEKPTLEEAHDFCKSIRKSIHILGSLTLDQGVYDATITFPKGILEKSILKFQIHEFQAYEPLK
jgi:hypothetical protein